MQYLCTIVHTDTRYSPDGHKIGSDTTQHVFCRNKKEAEDMAEILAMSQRKLNIRTDVSVRMFKRGGGSVVLPIDHWRDMAERFMNDDTAPTARAAE